MNNNPLHGLRHSYTGYVEVNRLSYHFPCSSCDTSTLRRVLNRKEIDGYGIPVTEREAIEAIRANITFVRLRGPAITSNMVVYRKNIVGFQNGAYFYPYGIHTTQLRNMGKKGVQHE